MTGARIGLSTGSSFNRLLATFRRRPLSLSFRACLVNASALQADHQAKWGSKAVAFRTLLPLIAEGHPTADIDPKQN